MNWAGLRYGQLLGLGLMLVAFAGCQTKGTGPGTGDSASVEDHHGIPAHKPKTFAAAIETLSDRLRGWPESGDGIDREELAIVTDIVRWLPELAADTDLRRADWEQVLAISGRFDEGLSTKRIDLAACQRFTQELRPFLTLVDDATTKGAFNNEATPQVPTNGQPQPGEPQVESAEGTNG
jgi:hypothetical protein